MQTLVRLARRLVTGSPRFFALFRLENHGRRFRELGFPDLVGNPVGPAKLALANLSIASAWPRQVVLIATSPMWAPLLRARLSQRDASHARLAPSSAAARSSRFV